VATTHLVPVVLLVGEHQEAPIIDEDADEVLEKEGSVTHTKVGQAGDGQPGRGDSAVSPSLGAAQQHLGAGSRTHHPPWGG